MAKQNHSPATIHLSHLFSDNTGQAGMVNVHTVNLFSNLQFVINRAPAHEAISGPSRPTEDPNARANEPTAKDEDSATDAPTAFHAGADPVRQTLISGKRHTIVHPNSAGTFRILYTKTQSLFTFTPPSSENASPSSETEKPKGPVIKNIDGYRIKFDTLRTIEHTGLKDADRENDSNAPALLGYPLSIYRSGRGTEYFLLTNFYFDPPAQQQNDPAGDVFPEDEPPAAATAPPSDRASHPSLDVQPSEVTAVPPGGPAPDPNESPDVAPDPPVDDGSANSPADVNIADRSLQITLSSGSKEVTKRTFYLENPPVKLGDGSFGVVYRIRELLGVASESLERENMHSTRSATWQPGARYALKIFYNRQMMTRTGLIRVEPDSFNKFVIDDNDQIKDVREISIARFMEHIFKSLKNNRNSPDDVHAQAMEILGQSERLQNVSAKRFGNERNISRSIREVLESEAGMNANAITCVQTDYDTTRFRESSMFQFLKEIEQKKNSSTADNLSDYAIVMELYNFTLEDLLEAQWEIWKEAINDSGATYLNPELGKYRALPVFDENIIERREVKLRTENYPYGDRDASNYKKVVTGYSILQSLPFAQRLSVIYPIVEGLATALQMLHATRNYHHDIKPGNVFINASLENFYVALGDFSFVGSGVDQGTTEAVLRDAIQTGSLHFRSPEQRDFNDAAYGIVRHSRCCEEPGPEYANLDADEQRGWAYVRIPDPKFRGSTIGPNDVVVFPADRNGTGFRVDRVHSSGDHRDVWLNVDAKEFSKLFPEETRTKVFLYKVPTVRSDLFGLGAVFFDLLTGGRSAERFYEALRPFDVPAQAEGDEQAPVGQGVRRLNAKDVADQFDTYRRGREIARHSEVGAALSNMFQFFHKDGDFAPREVVEIIIKLMGGYLEDSYVNTSRAERPVSRHLVNIAAEALPVSWALQDIKAVERKGIYDWREGLVQKGANNLLLRPEESQQLLAIVVKAHGAIPPESKEQVEDDAATQEGKAQPKSWIDKVAERLRTVPRKP